jgi:hypothetical protein
VSSAEAFNQSGFSRFINRPAGRVFRLAAGAGFLVVGYLFRDHPLGVISMVYSVLPLSAGAFDICFISAVLGGPLSGAKIREAQRRQPQTAAQKPKQP